MLKGIHQYDDYYYYSLSSSLSSLPFTIIDPEIPASKVAGCVLDDLGYILDRMEYWVIILLRLGHQCGILLLSTTDVNFVHG
jgi:hypothetical protein